jgi:hypothetical protein
MCDSGSRQVRIIRIVLFIGTIIFLEQNATYGATFCVNTANALASALQLARSNGADDVIRVVQGTYQGTFAYDSAEAFDLTIEGGYLAGCGSRVINAANTVLDGNSAGTVLTVFSSGLADIVVDGLTLQHGKAAAEAAGLQVPCCRSSNGVSLTLMNSILRDNTLTATGSFGAGGLGYYGARSLIVKNNVIEGNQSSSYGAISSNGGLEILITNNTISHNTASEGGGMYLHTGFCGAGVVLTNNVVTDNTATYGAGGVSVGTNCNSSVVITNNTIARNSGSQGGGLYVRLNVEAGISSIYNNILWNNSAAQGADLFLDNDGNRNSLPSPVTLSNNDFDQSAAGTFMQIPFAIAPSNLNNLNPLFVNTAISDYQLQAGSPVIDKGINSAPNLPSSDREGKPRISPTGGIVDLGAFEFVSAVLCDIQLNKTSFVNGDQVTAQVLRLANLSNTAVPIEIKLWLNLQGLAPLSILRIGGDGSVVFPAGFNQNIGPVGLFTVGSELSRGGYALNCRFLDPVSGSTLAEDLNSFVIR